MADPPMVKLLMKITRLPLDVVRIILGYIPVRRRRLRVHVPIFGTGIYQQGLDSLDHPFDLGGRILP